MNRITQTQPTNYHIVFAGGGTAGHLFPGLAVAETLLATNPQVRITFAGGGRTLDTRLVNDAGYGYFAHPCKPVPKHALLAWQFLTSSVKGFYAARHFLKQEQAHLVVGLGGYVSVPMVRAAVSLGLPVVLLEQNVVLGRANRWLASMASTVCLSFDEAREQLSPEVRVVTTGNPVRASVVRAGMLRRAAGDDHPQILILGGSGGMAVLDAAAPRALYKLRKVLAGWNIVHQARASELDNVRDLYAKLGLQATISSFFDNMPQLLATSSLVVSAAGGTTLAELAATSTPAVLVPYAKAAEQHQAKNAAHFAASGAVRVVNAMGDDVNPLADAIAHELEPLIKRPHIRERMREAMTWYARPNAAERVVKAIATTLREWDTTPTR